MSDTELIAELHKSLEDKTVLLMKANQEIERLDKANDEKNDLIDVMKTLYDILGGAYSVRNQEKSLELLEETLNRYDDE